MRTSKLILMTVMALHNQDPACVCSPTSCHSSPQVTPTMLAWSPPLERTKLIPTSRFRISSSFCLECPSLGSSLASFSLPSRSQFKYPLLAWGRETFFDTTNTVALPLHTF